MSDGLNKIEKIEMARTLIPASTPYLKGGIELQNKVSKKDFINKVNLIHGYSKIPFLPDNLLRILNTYPVLSDLVRFNPGLISFIMTFPKLLFIILRNPSLLPLVAENPSLASKLIFTGEAKKTFTEKQIIYPDKSVIAESHKVSLHPESFLRKEAFLDKAEAKKIPQANPLRTSRLIKSEKYQKLLVSNEKLSSSIRNILRLNIYGREVVSKSISQLYEQYTSIEKVGLPVIADKSIPLMHHENIPFNYAVILKNPVLLALLGSAAMVTNKGRIRREEEKDIKENDFEPYNLYDEPLHNISETEFETIR